MNNSISATQTTEPATPISDYNIGGAYGCRLYALSLGYNSSAQVNAYFKVVVDGIFINPSTFQLMSQVFNTFNFIAAGDYWEVPPNAHLKVYAYNQQGSSGNTGMVFDLLADARQYMDKPLF